MLAADRVPVASWSFDEGRGPDEIRGFHKFVEGMAVYTRFKPEEIGIRIEDTIAVAEIETLMRTEGILQALRAKGLI
jgi:Xaa-Pro aminopeptidase